MARSGKAAHNRKKIARTASGRPSRAKQARQEHKYMTEKEAKSVVIEQRKKWGVEEKDAEKPLAGTACGRLFLNGDLSADQLNAAEWYVEALNAYKKAIKSPGAIYSSTGTSIQDEEQEIEICRKAIKRMEKIANELNREIVLGNLEKDIAQVINGFLIDDKTLYKRIPDFRLALNVIHRVQNGKAIHS